MMQLAINPSPGAANESVPKKGLGIEFCTDGVPGKAVIVNVKAPKAIAPGSKLIEIWARSKRDLPIGYIMKATTNKEIPP
jgi:hypothetical protein